MGNIGTSGGGRGMSSTTTPTDTVPTTGVGIGPHTILRDIVGSLYNSFNDLAKNFGFTIPQALVFIAVLIGILMLWSFVGAIRNRQSFSLVDEDETA